MDITNLFQTKVFMTDLNASTTYEKTQINLQHKFTHSVVEHKFADYYKTRIKMSQQKHFNSYH